MCNKPWAKSCSKCHSSHYCSEDCQAADWDSHKLLCKKFRLQGKRPSSTHKRAICFPLDTDQPRMLWLPCKHGANHDVESSWSCKDLPRDDISCIQHNSIRDKHLSVQSTRSPADEQSYSVCLKAPVAWRSPTPGNNRSIMTCLSRSSDSTTHNWREPIIAVRQDASNRCEDITLDDFRHVVDCFRSHNNGNLRVCAGNQEDCPSTSIHGVTILNDGERELHGSGPFLLVDVPRSHPTRALVPRGDICTISELLGTPLRIWQPEDSHDDSQEPGLKGSSHSTTNNNATFLMMEARIGKSGWGWTPKTWILTDPGKVVAVREDGENLTVDEVSLMCAFARQKLQPMFEDGLGGGLVQRTQQGVVNYICRENMLAFGKARAEEPDQDVDQSVFTADSF